MSDETPKLEWNEDGYTTVIPGFERSQISGCLWVDADGSWEVHFEEIGNVANGIANPPTREAAKLAVEALLRKQITPLAERLGIVTAAGRLEGLREALALLEEEIQEASNINGDGVVTPLLFLRKAIQARIDAEAKA